MAQEGKIGLTIDRKVWKKLSQKKLDKDFKTFDEVLKYLLKVENTACNAEKVNTQHNAEVVQ